MHKRTQTMINWITDDRITLIRDHNYWGDSVEGREKRNYAEQLIYKSVKEFHVALTGLKKGEIDMTERELMSFIQSKIGSPNFLRKGKMHHLLNNLYFFL